jgi:PBP1b-binding outer membrane lipoprotein LpoB
LKRVIRKIVAVVSVAAGALILSSCLQAVQETTVKSKFKKKYDCPFKKIEVVEDDVVVGDTIKLRGCGKTVTYEGTKEVRVEE